jgi:predicted N-acetyltransferase YhbS
MDQNVIRCATESDAAVLFDLINEAYHVESGNVPPAFKLTTRFLSPTDLQPLLASGRVLICERGGFAVGVLSYSVESHPPTILRAHFGPFAVSRQWQGKGVGGALLRELAVRARSEGCVSLDAEVVNHRHDLFPMYLGRLGFRVVGEIQFPAPERLSRPAHFVCIRKPLGP